MPATTRGGTRRVTGQGVHVSPERLPRILTLTLAAVVRDGTAVLLDKHGRRIGAVRVGRIGPLDGPATEKYLWRAWANAEASRWGHRFRMGLYLEHNAWARKAKNLAASFRLRKHRPPAVSHRRRLCNFLTKTWWDAAKRMQRDGHYQLRYSAMTGWEKWAMTVSRNENKRADERYG